MKKRLLQGTRLSRWLSLLLWIAAFFLGGINETRADDTYIWVKRTTIDRDNAWTDVWLHCGEDEYGTYSYWYDNPVVKIDGVQVATFKDLGIPTLASEGSKKAIMSKLESLRPYNEVYKNYNPNHWISITMWDPQLNGDKDNYHMRMIIHLGWNPQGGKHKIEIVGKWVNNDGSPYSKTLSWETSTSSVDNIFPSSVSITRKNGKIVTSWSGLGTHTNYANDFYLYNYTPLPGVKDDTNKNKFDKWRTGSASGSHETNANNWESHTITPRMYHYTDYYDPTFISNVHKTWIKTYSAIRVKGYPKASDVNVSTINTYTKDIKITWGTQIHNSNAVDTNGKWYIFRRKAGDKNTANTKKLGEVN